MMEMLSGISDREGISRKIVGFPNNYMAVLRKEQILQNFEDQKISNFFNLEQVNFCLTLAMYVSIF